MTLVRFRPPIPGPEHALEAAVAEHCPPALGADAGRAWLAASAPIGAGRPDLLIVSYSPELLALKGTSPFAAHVLSYLYCVPRAGAPDIAQRLRKRPSQLLPILASLLTAGAITGTPRAYRLAPSWRRILTDVTAIEVKMADWRNAARQAARNRLLAHRSYIALPPEIARRAVNDPFIARRGLGVVEAAPPDYVRIIRPSKRGVPSVPHYYFAIAALIAG